MIASSPTPLSRAVLAGGIPSQPDNADPAAARATAIATGSAIAVYAERGIIAGATAGGARQAHKRVIGTAPATRLARTSRAPSRRSGASPAPESVTVSDSASALAKRAVPLAVRDLPARAPAWRAGVHDGRTGGCTSSPARRARQGHWGEAARTGRSHGHAGSHEQPSHPWPTEPVQQHQHSTACSTPPPRPSSRSCSSRSPSRDPCTVTC